MNKALSLLLYAGVGKEEFAELKKDYIEQNRNNLFWYSLVVMAFFGVLGIFVSLKSGIFVENAIPYYGTAAAMAFIMVCARALSKVKKKDVWVRCLIYLFMAVLYVEAASVTLKHPDLPAVTFIGILLVLPLLFVERPIVIMAAQTVFVAVFCVLVRSKDPYIASTDVWNGITFLIASWAEILILIPMRMSNMQKTKRIEILSTSDLLTGVLNRNAYEEHIKKISDHPEETLVCIYADVNGLHEMNNTLGHDAGDQMLKCVAEELLYSFGHDEIYRIGGDEFVVLSVNREYEAVLELLSGIRDVLKAKGHFVSFGMSSVKDHDMDMQSTIKEAEQRMYEAKRQYYIESGRDRRSRN